MILVGISAREILDPSPVVGNLNPFAPKLSVLSLYFDNLNVLLLILKFNGLKNIF